MGGGGWCRRNVRKGWDCGEKDSWGGRVKRGIGWGLGVGGGVGGVRLCWWNGL